MSDGRPRSVAIDHDDHAAQYIGRTADGRQLLAACRALLSRRAADTYGRYVRDQLDLLRGGRQRRRRVSSRPLGHRVMAGAHAQAPRRRPRPRRRHLHRRPPAARRRHDRRVVHPRRRHLRPLPHLAGRVLGGNDDGVGAALAGYAERHGTDGRTRLAEAYRDWAFKHPQPADFFRTIEEVSGRDLSWFWRGFFYTTAVLDQSVESVKQEAGGPTAVTLANLGYAVMPVELKLAFSDGTTDLVRLPVEIWYGGDDRPHQPATLEGGDIHVLGYGAVMVGLGERSTPMGVENLARGLFAKGGATKVIAIELPHSHAMMHLDTVMTMVDRDAVTLFPEVVRGARVWSIRPGDDPDLPVVEPFGGDVIESLKHALGLGEIRAIETGGDRGSLREGQRTRHLRPRHRDEGCLRAPFTGASR